MIELNVQYASQFQTDKGVVDVDTIARERLPDPALHNAAGHLGFSVRLTPTAHGMPKRGDIKVKYRLHINNNEAVRDPETGLGKRTWILHAVRLMNYIGSFVPKITGQARILLGTVGLVAANLTADGEVTTVSTVIDFLKKKKIDYNTDLAKQLLIEEKESGESVVNGVPKVVTRAAKNPPKEVIDVAGNDASTDEDLVVDVVAPEPTHTQEAPAVVDLHVGNTIDEAIEKQAAAIEKQAAGDLAASQPEKEPKKGKKGKKVTDPTEGM